MRALSLRQAARCENATRPKCRCRCGGKLHGAKRVPTTEQTAMFALPQDDPHRPAEPRRKAQEARP